MENYTNNLDNFMISQMNAVEMFRSYMSKTEERKVSPNEAYLEWIEDNYATKWRKNWDSHIDASGNQTLTTEEIYRMTTANGEAYKAHKCTIEKSDKKNTHRQHSLETTVAA